MMPFLGVQLTYLFIAFLTLMSGIYLLFKDSRLIRLFRLSYALLAILIFILIAGAFHYTGSGWTASAREKKIEGYAASFSTQMNADSTKSVLLNGNYIFGTDQRSLKAQLLPVYLSLLINQNVHSALVIGFGTGLTASKLEEKGVREIQITDMYPEVIRLSSDVFADENNDIMTNHHVKISVEDGRGYLIRSNSNVDLIVFGYDLFKQMPSLYTSEFYQLCAKKLSDQGLLCQILPIKEISSKAFKALIKSCSIAFSTVNLWYVSPEHVLMLASDNQFKIEFCALSAAFLAMNADKSFTGIGIPNAENLLAHSLLGGNQVSRLCINITENTDNKPLTFFSIFPDKEKEDNLLMEFNQTRADFELPVLFSKSCVADSLSTYKQIRRINQQLLQQDGLSSSLQF
jgi:multisubunit Na+/H+ antiporter MnhC subunit